MSIDHPCQIEMWTDLRIVVSNYDQSDVGENWRNIGIMITSVDYDVDLEKGSMIFIERERIPELISILKAFV